MNKINAVDFTNIKVHELLSQAESQDINWLSDDDSRFRILDRIKNPREFTGFTLPWAKSEDKIRLRPSELSVIGGYNGHNKSTIASQIALHIAKSAPVGIASLEMELEDVGAMLVKQAAITDNPDTRWANDFVTWTDSRIAVYDRLDSIPPHIALAAIWHMAANLGCKFILLDSLMMCDVCDDIERERKFVATLAAMAKRFKIHIMLVHHMRKPKDEQQIPSKYDLLGAGHISNMAMTILIAWEDKKRKTDKNFAEQDPDKPDQLLIVAKQRHGQFEGAMGLWRMAGRAFSGTSRNELRPLQIQRMGEAA